VTNWGNPVGAQPVAQDSTEKPAPSAEVARMTDTAAPLPMTITKDDDGCFFIAIGDRKWKICRPGIIGKSEKDRRDFRSVFQKECGFDLDFSDDIESTISFRRKESLEHGYGKYQELQMSRGNTDKSLGQIAYECFQSSTLGLPSAPAWADVPEGSLVRAEWERLGDICYHSVGTFDDIEKEIQVRATRKRLQLLRDTGRFALKESTDVASFLSLVAGPPVERKA
jgi:hypothetical protein